MQQQDKQECLITFDKKRSDLSHLFLLKKDLMTSKPQDKINELKKADEKGQKENMSKDANHNKHNVSFNNGNFQLPKILKLENRGSFNQSIILKADGFKSHKKLFDPKFSAKNDLNTSNLNSIIKISQTFLGKTNQQSLKQLQKISTKTTKKPFHKRLPKKINILPKEQRYFQMIPFEISPQKIKQLGYYQAANIYKPSNINILFEKGCLRTQPYQNMPSKLLGKNDIFLTNLKKEDLVFKVEQFVDFYLSKQKQYETVVKQQYKNQNVPPEPSVDEQVKIENQKIDEILVEQRLKLLQNIIYVTIADYQFVKNEEFKLFKIKNLNNWGEIMYNFQRICKCLKAHKIGYFKIKSDILLKWSGHKYTLSQVNKDLGLECIEKIEDKVLKYCMAFIDRLKVKKIKQVRDKKQNLARWVCQRIKVRTQIRKIVRQKIQKAMHLHRKLIKNMQWDVQIHLCSFSVESSKRSTSQYIDSFENIYHQIWNNNNKEIILIIPTLNQNIVKLLQNKLKIKKNIIIICPEVYEIFPINMSLTAQVLFSYETLQKLTNSIKGKKAVIIPGHFQNNKYELLLSSYLNAPLLCSLQIQNLHHNQKVFFDSADIANPKYCVIEPRSTYSNLIQTFSDLLIENVMQKKWIFKLNNEFNGRGIATLDLNLSKYIKKQNTQLQNKKILQDHLLSFLRLKLKITNQNSLYTVDKYLKEFEQKGGIIQQEIKTDCVYEISLKKHTTCQFRFLYQVYGVNYSNKAWLSCEPNQQLLPYIDKIQEALDSQLYYGFINISICKTNENQYYGMEVKLYPTYSSSMVSFIGMIQQRRLSSENAALNISNLKTIRPQHLPHQEQQPLAQSLCFSQYKYMLIPNLILTDIEEEAKAKMIQQIMQKCWTDKNVKINEQCVVYMSLGVDLSLILIGKDVKKLKKQGIDCMRQLNDKACQHRRYRGKQVVRDVFQFGDIIRAINKLKADQ